MARPDPAPWLAALRRSGAARLAALPAPAARDEAWRFGAPPAWDAQEWAALAAPRMVSGEDEKDATTGPSASMLGDALRVHFDGGRLANPGALEAIRALGAEVVALPEGADAAPAWAREMWGGICTDDAPWTLGGGKFAALRSAAGGGAGLALRLPAGLRLERPIEIIHCNIEATEAGKEAADFPMLAILAEEKSAGTVVERWEGGGARMIGECALGAARGADLRHALVQRLDAQAEGWRGARMRVAAGGSARLLQVHLGAGSMRTESEALVGGEGARAELLATGIGDGARRLDQRSLQRHAAPGARSDLLYKVALGGRARSVFGGMILVEEGAHRTDAYQTCRHLMLGPDAQADAMPGLEIRADDVRCSHGATSAPIEPGALFYARARGVGAADARALLAAGFLREALERFGDAGLEAALEPVFSRRLAAMEAAPAGP